MIFIMYEIKNDPNKGKVVFCHNMPHDPIQGLTQDILDKGIEVESIPNPEIRAGYIPVLFVNPNTKEFFYEYQPQAPLSSQEDMAIKIVELQKSLLEAQNAINSLLGV